LCIAGTRKVHYQQDDAQSSARLDSSNFTS
jgi:hypothetical protein